MEVKSDSHTSGCIIILLTQKFKGWGGKKLNTLKKFKVEQMFLEMHLTPSSDKGVNFLIPF
jgi:sulfur transfer protein SufE